MFYEYLKSECERQGFKITPIVLECGGAKGSISAWKNGSMPHSDIVLKLSERLNVPCDYLLTGKKTTSTNVLLADDEQEMLAGYRNLDKRGRCKLYTVLCDELDRVQHTDELPPIPFAASGWADLTPENEDVVQQKLQAFEQKNIEMRERAVMERVTLAKEAAVLKRAAEDKALKEQREQEIQAFREKRKEE